MQIKEILAHQKETVLAQVTEKPRGTAATGFNHCGRGQCLYLDSTSPLPSLSSDRLYPGTGRQRLALQTTACQVQAENTKDSLAGAPSQSPNSLWSGLPRITSQFVNQPPLLRACTGDDQPALGHTLRVESGVELNLKLKAWDWRIGDFLKGN